VGDSFDSFEQLKQAIASSEQNSSVSLYKRDCRSIEAAARKGVKRDVRGQLVYCSVQHACYHGGNKFKSRSAGSRPQQR